MSLTVLVGGARSGKSAHALRLAGSAESVVFIATAEAGDDEMAARIESHRVERPGGWATVEEPVGIREALESSPVDCLRDPRLPLTLGVEPHATGTGRTRRSRRRACDQLALPRREALRPWS